jgi:hypothetical protein
MRALKVVYVLAIAAALIALVIVGLNTFYPAPSYSSTYDQEMAVYGRNVFLIALPLGIVLAVVGGFLQRRTSIFGAGLIVGGMGTMIFALTPYYLDDVLVFVGIAVILAVLTVGYRLFFYRRRT